MPAPQQVGAARTASTTPVFWVSTGEPTTAFSRATNGFLATRTPLATAELNRKIAMMAPQDKDKAILDLLTAESEHVKNMAIAGKDYRQQMNDALKYATDVERQAIQGQATTRAASVQARGRLRGQELGRDVNLRQMEELKPEDSSYADTLKQQLATALDDVEKEELLTEAFGGVTPEGQTIPGRLASASPAAKQRLSQELHALYPDDVAFGQKIDEHVGPGDINAPEDMLGGDVAGDIGDGRDVTARNLGARDPQVGEAGKFALEQARRMAANEPTATSSTQGDAVMGQFGEQLASLRAQNGRSRRVDFNAPLIRDEEYAKPWDQIEQSLASPGGSGTEFGAQLATSLKSAAQRGRAHGGMTEADLMAGADQRRSFQGPITEGLGLPARAARVTEGNDAAAMAQGPSQGAGGAGRGAGAPVGGARKPPAWQGPRQLPNMGRQGGLTPEQYAEVDRIIAARKRVSDSVPGILTAGAFGAAHGGQNPDRFAEHGAARARAAVNEEEGARLAAENDAQAAKYRQDKTDEALAGIEALTLEPTPTFAQAKRPQQAVIGQQAPEQNQNQAVQTLDSEADIVHTPAEVDKIKAELGPPPDMPFVEDKHRWAAKDAERRALIAADEYRPPPRPRVQQSAAAPVAAAAGGPSLLGAIEGQTQQAQPVAPPPPMTMDAGPDPRTLDIIARVKARRAGQGAP